jgi:hypothetical protein
MLSRWYLGEDHLKKLVVVFLIIFFGGQILIEKLMITHFFLRIFGSISIFVQVFKLIPYDRFAFYAKITISVAISMYFYYKSDN